MKYMDVKEFCDEGYLQEVNRQFFHPLGLALVIQVDDDGTHSLAGIWDNRDDPEGIYFKDLDAEKIIKARKVMDKQTERGIEREKALGFVVEPVPMQD